MARRQRQVAAVAGEAHPTVAPLGIRRPLAAHILRGAAHHSPAAAIGSKVSGRSSKGNARDRLRTHPCKHTQGHLTSTPTPAHTKRKLQLV